MRATVWRENLCNELKGDSAGLSCSSNANMQMACHQAIH